MRAGFLLTTCLVAPLLFIAPLAQAQTDVPANTAAAQTGEASQFIQNLASNALNSIAGQRLSDDETTQRFRTLLRENFDLKTIGRFALGPYWNAATPDQRQTYQQEFENMIVDAYALRFRDYSGGSFKAGKEMQQGNDMLVQSDIGQSNGAPPVAVTWRVRKEADGYKIIDVAVEGVSMSQTERSEFSAFIERNGGQIQPLIDAMKNHTIGLANPNQ
jgi:phospholipid transport system substrate-binding protein